MADFTKIDQRVAAALLAEEPHIKQRLATIAPREAQFDLEPCGNVIDEVARFVFEAAIEAAAEGPELATQKRLRPYLSNLRPHLIEAVIGERERAAVFGQTRAERNRKLDDYSLIGAGKGELFVAGPASDSWKVAPAAVQVVYEPIGLYERLAPPSCRYVMRGNADLARKLLRPLFDGAVERYFARWLAARAAGAVIGSAGADETRPTKPTAPSLPTSIGRPRKFSEARREAARDAIRKGGSWKDAAAALLEVRRPSLADRKTAAKLLGPKSAIMAVISTAASVPTE
jgi:hypothetical protein